MGDGQGGLPEQGASERRCGHAVVPRVSQPQHRGRVALVSVMEPVVCVGGCSAASLAPPTRCQ